jgi:hypothetical protein
MPRIRTIKPEFFTSDTVSELPLRARLTWIGLWTHCDDHGRCRANVKLIKAAVWPLDNVSLREIEDDIEALSAQRLVFGYIADDGKNYLQITGWTEHQKVDRPSKSIIPAPTEAQRNAGLNPRPVDNPVYRGFSQVGLPSRDPREDVASTREPLALERKGKERKGADSRRLANTSATSPSPPDPEPPSKCEEHKNLAKPPACGACADARRTNEEWHVERRRRIADAPKCPHHRGQLAHNCSICASEVKAASARALGETTQALPLVAARRTPP